MAGLSGIGCGAGPCFAYCWRICWAASSNLPMFSGESSAFSAISEQICARIASVILPVKPNSCIQIVHN